MTSPTSKSSPGSKGYTAPKGGPTRGRDEARSSSSQKPTRKSVKKKAPKPSAASIAEERTLAQARAKERRAANDKALAEHFSSATTGGWLLVASWLSTAVFVVPTMIATITNSTSTRHFAAYVSLALFTLSLFAFLLALWLGAQRSRRDEMTMAGWWFLSGSAPSKVKAQLWGSLALQVLVSIVCASLRFETSIAFGVLVPTLGLSFLGLWGALYGFFPRREFHD